MEISFLFLLFVHVLQCDLHFWAERKDTTAFHNYSGTHSYLESSGCSLLRFCLC